MKKHLIFFMAILLFIAPVRIARSSADEAHSQRIPRIVSVVFDDSGSMAGIDTSDTDESKYYRWAYASYAMQTFVAMMSSDDVLYVTYLNDKNQKSNKTGLSSGKVNLESGKKNEIQKFKNLLVQGGTPNKLSTGANHLIDEYKKYGANAKYYLVVMADGGLDAGEDFKSAITAVSSETANALQGVDFETIFFSIGNKVDISGISGITSKKAMTSSEIIASIKDISAAIMGRTEVTADANVTNGKLSFELKYPAYNISLFVQKENSPFGNIEIPIYYNDKSANSTFTIESYVLDCPEGQPQIGSLHAHMVPQNKPYGFVSLISNGSSVLPKGNYSIDLSAYDISKENIVLLVEPAVKAGCKFFLGDDPEPYSFEDIKDNLHDGENFTIECGLYEITPDGSLGEKIPSSILDPNYTLSINGASVTPVNSQKGVYNVTMTKNFENKELKVEAALKGYQPFVLKETFGKLKERPVINQSANDSKKISLTKPLFSEWSNKKGGISFEFSKIYDTILNDLEIKIDGTNEFSSGKCSELSEVKIEGNNIIYTPKATDFDSLPDNFIVSIYDSYENKLIAKREVEVIRPIYKVEIENELINTQLSIADLQSNTKSVKFTLCVDYENDGEFIPISKSTCETKKHTIELNETTLPGKATQKSDYVSFVPAFSSGDKGSESAALLDSEHVLSATATIGDTTIESEEISFFISKVSYIFDVDSDISESFTLDSLKENTDKITFTLLADYDGGENYGPLASVDSDIYDTIEINSGELPGKIEKAKNGLVSFTPYIDSKTSPADLLGKTHKIYATATINGKIVRSEEIAISFSQASYALFADSEISEDFTLDSLKANQKKVIFKILADYNGGENYGPLADWDSEILNSIQITNSELPGKIEDIYNGKTPVGKAFIPQYDENAPGAVPYTAVTGIEVKKTHVISATLAGHENSEVTAEISVLAPKHTVEIQKEGISIVDVELTKNTDGVEFVIFRDNRQLTKAELEALSYKIYPSRNKKHIALDIKVLDDGNDNAYIFVRPSYAGWTFISPYLWEWANLFLVKDGEMEIVIEFNNQMVGAKMNVGTNSFVFMVFCIALGVIAFIAYFAFCCLTRIRFAKGKLYRATFTRNFAGWSLSNVEVIRARSYILPHHILLPFKSMRKRVRVFENFANVVAPKAFALERTYPHWIIEPESQLKILPDTHIFNTGALRTSQIEKIVNFDNADSFDENILGHTTKFDPKDGISISLESDFISELSENQLSLVFFVSK